MMRHGSSHGMALLVCTIASGFIVSLMQYYLPELLLAFRQVVVFICTFLEISSPPEAVEATCLAACLSFVWGMAFRLSSGS